jgi:DNA-binding MarR family transcriptional regulator
MEKKEDLIESILRRLMRIINKQRRIEDVPVRLDKDIEVTPTESHTIQVIGERKLINVTDLSVHFGVTKSAASQIVTKLANKGFVEKNVSDYSSKELQLTLTELGRRAFEAHERCYGQHLADMAGRLSSFSLSQIAVAAVMLDMIEDVMDERLKKR